MYMQSAYSKTNKPSIMKVLKVLAIVLVVLIGLYVVFAAVSPSELYIEKIETINAPASAVMANVVCLDKWPAWSAWQKMDTAMKNEYSDDPCGAGAWNSWDGPNSGKGKQTIEQVNGEESIKMNLVFEGFDGINYANWTFEEADGVTTVTWTFEGAPSPFMMRPMNLMMKGVLEESYQTGLAALKVVTEANPMIETGYSIYRIDIPAFGALLISGDVKSQEIGEFYANSFGKIMGYMTEQGAEMQGFPSGFFYNWTDTLAKMSAGIAITAPVEGNSEIEFREFEAKKGVKVDYYGAYDESMSAHIAINEYMQENDLEIDGAVIEVYVTDSMAEPDTSKWLTHIIYPVKEQ